jgi:hypothetical protein
VIDSLGPLLSGLKQKKLVELLWRASFANKSVVLTADSLFPLEISFMFYFEIKKLAHSDSDISRSRLESLVYPPGLAYRRHRDQQNCYLDSDCISDGAGGRCTTLSVVATQWRTWASAARQQAGPSGVARLSQGFDQVLATAPIARRPWRAAGAGALAA